MCSTPDPRLTLIGAAIDELAAEALAHGDKADTMAARLADVWAMVAALDPGLAQRLPGYTE
ncbi:MAG: hypothetical protein ACLPKI_25435 [Streptosporangiaceae bacterium]